MIAFVGDVHGKYEAVYDIMSKLSGVEYWIQIGDFGGEDLLYPDKLLNFCFIQGNHENWDELERRRKEDDFYFAPNGTVIELKTGVIPKGLCIGIFGGNYSSRFIDKKRSELQGGRRRHFVQEDYDALIKYKGKIDILVTHEAPDPYPRGGQKIITDLIDILKPKIHFFGHHHHYGVYEYCGVPSIGLDYGHRSVVLYDPEDHKIKKVDIDGD